MAANASYLPAIWSDDHEMSGLMSMLKLKHVNPTNYQRVVSFWMDAIESYCRSEKQCLISFDELKMRFKRGNQLPAPLLQVLEELHTCQKIVPVNELSSPRQGWWNWGTTIIKSSWLTGTRVDFPNVQFVHIPTLKMQARELLEFYKVQYEMVDCPEIVAYDELKSRCSNICNPSTFDLVVDELIRRGEVSIGSLENGEQILKFKDQTSKGPAKFTRADASVHELRRTMMRVDSELRRIEQRVKRCDQEARDAVHRKDRNGALQALRKKKRAEKEMTDKDVQYQRLVHMLEQLASSKQTREVLDAYKTGTRAYKDALERQGLTLDNVDDTMDSVNEVMQDAKDIDDALRDGFSNIPMPASAIDDGALEDELKAIMEEEGTTTAAAAAPSKSPATSKRVVDFSDLPRAPNTPLTVPGADDEVAQRLRRLRQGLHA